MLFVCLSCLFVLFCLLLSPKRTRSRREYASSCPKVSRARLSGSSPMCRGRTTSCGLTRCSFFWPPSAKCVANHPVSIPLRLLFFFFFFNSCMSSPASFPRQNADPAVARAVAEILLPENILLLVQTENVPTKIQCRLLHAFTHIYASFYVNTETSPDDVSALVSSRSMRAVVCLPSNCFSAPFTWDKQRSGEEEAVVVSAHNDGPSMLADQWSEIKASLLLWMGKYTEMLAPPPNNYLISVRDTRVWWLLMAPPQIAAATHARTTGTGVEDHQQVAPKGPLRGCRDGEHLHHGWAHPQSYQEPPRTTLPSLPPPLTADRSAFFFCVRPMCIVRNNLNCCPLS